jgi:raffinose/stachyose/melibiose transport system permease protein
MRELSSSVRVRTLKGRHGLARAAYGTNGIARQARRRSLFNKLGSPDFVRNELAWISLYVPALAMFLLFVIYPLFQSIYVSLTDWDGIRPAMQFIGFENYKVLSTDNVVLRTISTTFKYTITVTVAQNLLALLMALVLNQQLRSRNVLRTMIFMPSILSGLIVGYIWSFLYSDPIMKLGRTLGWTLLANNALSSQVFAIYATAFVTTWRASGWTMMIYLAGLQNIPQELEEAAAIDGASVLRRLRHITIPLLAPTFTINVILTFERGLKDFDSIFALTGGGPGAATMTMALNIYRESFYFSRAGYGTAIGVILFVTIVVLSVIQLRYFRKGEERIA